MSGVIGIIGTSGSGKTTLICRILRTFPDQRSTVIKRTHHPVPGFSGGKDTDRYIEAGAYEALLVTPVAIHRWKNGEHQESDLLEVEEIVRRSSEASDLVIVESAKYDGSWPRILVHDQTVPMPEPFPPHVKAIVSNHPDQIFETLPQFDRDDIDAIRQFVIRITS